MANGNPWGGPSAFAASGQTGLGGQSPYAAGGQNPSAMGTGIGPGGYPVGAGARATDAGGGGTGIAGPQYVLAAGNPYGLRSGTIVATGVGVGPPVGGTPIRPGQTAQGQTFPWSAGISAGGPPAMVVAPPVNEWGRTAVEQAAWEELVAGEQATRDAELKRQSAAAAVQAQATQAAAAAQSAWQQQTAAAQSAWQQQTAYEEWRQQQQTALDQWNAAYDAAYRDVAAFNTKFAPDYNSLPVFQMLRGEIAAPSFQARAQAAAPAAAPPARPQLPGPPPGLRPYPVFAGTDVPAWVGSGMNELNQRYADAAAKFVTGGPKPPPIKVNLPNANKVNYQTLSNLLPSELGLLRSALASQGQYADDYLEAVRRSAPIARGVGVTGWG